MNNKENNTCCIVVTYNRKELLVNCLNAIKSQHLKPKVVLVIDNASTDQTRDYLIKKGFIDETNSSNQNNIIFKYIKKNENDGGAGGFSFGLKLAYKMGFEWFWIMDDDGVPHEDCLNFLHQYSSKGVIDYLAPNLIDFSGKSHFEYLWKETSLRTINYKGGPFNGILVSRFLLEKVGIPIKYFFIWGDEHEYVNRIEERGFITITVKDAIHYHKTTGFSFKKIPRVYYFSRNLILQTRLFKGMFRSKFVKKISCFYVILKIIILGLFSLNFKQVQETLNGIFDGFYIDIQKLQKEALIIDNDE